MSHHDPPPHPRDDTASDALKNRPSSLWQVVLCVAAAWLSGWFVFSPWFAGLLNAESSWSPFSWSQTRYVGLLVWLAFVSLAAFAWALVERTKASAQRR
jgi:hypothetical protein